MTDMTDNAQPDVDDDALDVAVVDFDDDPEGDQYPLTRPTDLASLQTEMARAFRTVKADDIALTSVEDPNTASATHPVALWVTPSLDKTKVQQLLDTHQYDPTNGGTS